MNGEPQVPVAFTSTSVDHLARRRTRPSNVTTNPSRFCSTLVTFAGRTTLRSKCSSYRRVVVGDDVLRRQLPVRGVEADAELVHAGQVVDPVRVSEAQRLPAVLPGAAGSGPAIEQHEVVARVEPEAPQVVSDGEPGLSRPDHDDGGVGRRGRSRGQGYPATRVIDFRAVFIDPFHRSSIHEGVTHGARPSEGEAHQGRTRPQVLQPGHELRCPRRGARRQTLVSTRT